MKRLAPTDVHDALQTLTDWQEVEGTLVRDFVFADFKAALHFVNTVGDLAEQAGHHPDIDIRWNKVRLALVTHSEGGLTDLDVALARQIQQITPG
jgi:4a-hydroxytetrahydrobiopterin dehydratase